MAPEYCPRLCYVLANRVVPSSDWSPVGYRRRRASENTMVTQQKTCGGQNEQIVAEVVIKGPARYPANAAAEARCTTAREVGSLSTAECRHRHRHSASHRFGQTGARHDRGYDHNRCAEYLSWVTIFFGLHRDHVNLSVGRFPLPLNVCSGSAGANVSACTCTHRICLASAMCAGVTSPG